MLFGKRGYVYRVQTIFYNQAKVIGSCLKSLIGILKILTNAVLLLFIEFENIHLCFSY